MVKWTEEQSQELRQRAPCWRTSEEEFAALAKHCNGKLTAKEAASIMCEYGFKREWTAARIRAYVSRHRHLSLMRVTPLRTFIIKREKPKKQSPISDCFSETLADSSSVLFGELNNANCCFPFIGDSKGSDTRCCGKPISRKGYCDHHASICYVR